MAIYNIKLSNILYDWQLSMASFHFCETYLLHIRPFVVNMSAISPFLSGRQHPDVTLSSSLVYNTSGGARAYVRSVIYGSEPHGDHQWSSFWVFSNKQHYFSLIEGSESDGDHQWSSFWFFSNKHYLSLIDGSESGPSANCRMSACHMRCLNYLTQRPNI